MVRGCVEGAAVNSEQAVYNPTEASVLTGCSSHTAERLLLQTLVPLTCFMLERAICCTAVSYAYMMLDKKLVVGALQNLTFTGEGRELKCFLQTLGNITESLAVLLKSDILWI